MALVSYTRVASDRRCVWGNLLLVFHRKRKETCRTENNLTFLPLSSQVFADEFDGDIGAPSVGSVVNTKQGCFNGMGCEPSTTHPRRREARQSCLLVEKHCRSASQFAPGRKTSCRRA